MNLLQSSLVKISDISFNTGQIPDVPKNPRFIKTERYEKLKKSLQDNPEMLPARELLVYNYDGELIVIGGNMRLRAAKELGYKEIPCKILEDLTPEQIRAIVIKDNVSFGSDDFEQLANEWDSIELEEWGLEVPTFDDIQPELKAVEDDKYTKKIDTPVYEPKNEKPKIIELYNSEKYKELIIDIENSSLSNDIKTFLKVAASRHIIFNYENIADFYSHSDKETQKLMENSALVIIDFNRAIELGFVKLNEEITDQYKNEYGDE